MTQTASGSRPSQHVVDSMELHQRRTQGVQTKASRPGAVGSRISGISNPEGVKGVRRGLQDGTYDITDSVLQRTTAEVVAKELGIGQVGQPFLDAPAGY